MKLYLLLFLATNFLHAYEQEQYMRLTPKNDEKIKDIQNQSKVYCQLKGGNKVMVDNHEECSKLTQEKKYPLSLVTEQCKVDAKNKILYCDGKKYSYVRTEVNQDGWYTAFLTEKEKIACYASEEKQKVITQGTIVIKNTELTCVIVYNEVLDLRGRRTSKPTAPSSGSDDKKPQSKSH